MTNFIDPAILFFVFGVVAGLVKSNLEIPPPISRFLSLYLLMALGLRGGFELAHSGLTPTVISGLVSALSLAILVPTIGYWLLKKVVSGFDAAAIAATYGSVSAVTFITATRYLDDHGIAFGGHMAAAMAFMESPAIVMAILFVNAIRTANYTAQGTPQTQMPAALSPLHILKESLTDGAQFLLIGSVVVGLISGDAGKAAMQPFAGDLFRGMLAFFLLDMGLMTARNFPAVRTVSPWLLAYAIIGPVVHASLALLIASVVGLSAGDAGLLMVLAASASYIAVPAVLRFAVPEANPSLYFGLSLGVTFPINILVGIPAYIAIAHHVLP
jgi:uncharacterized protein